MNKLFIIFLFLPCICFAGTSITAQDPAKNLSYVDRIQIHAYQSNGTEPDTRVIKIFFDYYSNQNGQTVFWNQGSGDCNCDINVEGRYVSAKSMKITSQYDKVFIDLYKNDVMPNIGKSCFVKCTLNAGNKTLEASDTITLR